MSSKNPIWSFSSLVSGVLLLMAPAARAQVKFSGPTNYPVGTTPGYTAVGDFNGDGKQDLAVVNLGSVNVSILLGNGDGTFQQAREISGNGTPAFVAVGDFNGDRKLDLAVAEGSANIVLIFLGNGDGTFQAPEQFNTDISADYVAVADFNNDKRSDLLVSTAGSVGILLGIGDGRFQSPIVTPIAYDTVTHVAIGDFNQDGKLDVATGYLGTTTCRPLCATNGQVLVLNGNGDGTFQPPVLSPVNFGPAYFVTGDLNGDGKSDLVVIADYFELYRGFTPKLCAYQLVASLLGNGDGTFRVSTIRYVEGYGVPSCSFFFKAPFATNIALADINNDGKLDLVFPVVVPNTSITPPTAIWVLLGYGDGTFQGAQEFTLPTAPSWLTVGNFNGDAFPDLALSNGSASNVGVYLNITPRLDASGQ